MTAVSNICIYIIISIICMLLQAKVSVRKSVKAKQVFTLFSAAVYCIILFVSAFTMDTPTIEDILAVNLGAVIGYILIKFILLCPIFSRLFRDRQKIDKLTGSSYVYDDNYCEYFLKDEKVTYRKFYCILATVTYILCGASLGVMRTLMEEEEVIGIIFPSIMAIFITEIYSYLNGRTKSEYLQQEIDVGFWNRINNFFRVREIFEKTFPGELLGVTQGCEYSSTQSSTNLLEKFQKSTENADKLIAEYFTSDEYTNYDVDCINATKELLNGKNVIFQNPFYRDLGDYVTLPVVKTLLNNKKCLILISRNSSREDIISWIKDLISEFTKMESLWKVEKLSDKVSDTQIGVLSFSQIYDRNVIETNKHFFENVGLVLVSEPSLIVNTGQIGLRIVNEYMKVNGNEPVYCVMDRMTEGIVDTISHLFTAEFTYVVAPPVPRYIYTAMAWNADGDYKRGVLFDKQSKFLGNGIELAALAIRNQVPKVSWYSDSKAPIKDIKWQVGQFYTTICHFMNVPIQQQSIYDKIKFESNIWSASKEEEQFVIAEDEFDNIFMAMRTYMSRGKEQTFINILSENYLLRDYMRCNPKLFLANPGVIPSLVPAYAKTERNTIVKLILLMVTEPVTETKVINEFALLGREIKDGYHELVHVLRKYTYSDASVIDITTHDESGMISGERLFSISKENFDKYFAHSLKNAYYIVEDELEEKEYVDAKLFGHISQTVLPGQYLTYDGKYYVVAHISTSNGVILHRASDMYDCRLYYKQIRRYKLLDGEDEIISSKKIMDVGLEIMECNFKVYTDGYLEMKTNGDLRGAKIIDISKDIQKGEFDRSYHNKRILRLEFPETDETLRLTMCILLSELFRTIFSSAWQYIAVLTGKNAELEGMINYITYDIEGNYDERYIYIIEDSEIDLGIIDAVQRNFVSIMELMQDYLEWHFEKMAESPLDDPITKTVKLPEDQKVRRGFFARIRQLVGFEKEKKVEIESVEKAEQTVDKKDDGAREQDSNLSDTTVETATIIEEAVVSSNGAILDNEHQGVYTQEAANADLLEIDGTDIFDESGFDDEYFFNDAFDALGIDMVSNTRYQEECYLKFGFNDINSHIHILELKIYLARHGWSNNSITEARRAKEFVENKEGLKIANYCDFCGKALNNVSYDRLDDGRIRCVECSNSILKSISEYQNLYVHVLKTMGAFFGIQYNKPIKVCIANAHKIARGAGSVFKPTSGFDARVLGYAQQRGDSYTINLENGSPRLACMQTMVHELTHIWQYLNWDDREIVKLYGKDRNRDIVYEGMAEWVSIQYLYSIGETTYARDCEQRTEKRDDIYGIGFSLFKEKYPLIRDSATINYSPFNTFPPL